MEIFPFLVGDRDRFAFLLIRRKPEVCPVDALELPGNASEAQRPRLVRSHGRLTSYVKEVNMSDIVQTAKAPTLAYNQKNCFLTIVDVFRAYLLPSDILHTGEFPLVNCLKLKTGRNLVQSCFITTVVFCTSFTACSQKVEGPRQVVVFESGKDGYNTYRIPSVIITPKGTVLAFCEARKELVQIQRNRPLRTTTADAGDIDTVLKRSLDNGTTWSSLQVIADDGPNTMGNPCAVIDRDTGTIWLLLTLNPGQDIHSQILDGTSEGTRTVWITKSTDDGATWSKPVEITKTTKAPDWTSCVTGPGVGIQLKSGGLVIPCYHHVAVSKISRSHVIYSDDHGANWKIGGIAGHNTDESECQVAELADGSLLLNMRNDARKALKYRTTATSTDGGLTWSEVTYDPGLIDPGCQGSLQRFTSQREHGKNRLLFSNPAPTERQRQVLDRSMMTVRLSYDEGKTWPVTKLLYPGPSAYSCLTVLPDTTIGCLYERGQLHPYEEIAFARFSLEWLTNGKDQHSAPP